MLKRTSDLNILGIAGSLRERSSSQLALEYAMNLLKNAGCQTRIFDLRTASLPFCDGNPEDQARTFAGVADMRRSVSEAHALLLVTPEYHGGISGVLKNALDLLNTKQLEGKLVGMVSVLGGAAGGNALNDLSRVMRCCHAWVIPQQIAIGRASTTLSGGQINDPELRLRFDDFADRLVQSSLRLCGFDSREGERRNAYNLPVAQVSQSATS